MKKNKLKDLSHYPIRVIAQFLFKKLDFDPDIALSAAYWLKFPKREFILQPDALYSKVWHDIVELPAQMLAQAKNKETRLTDLLIALKDQKRCFPKDDATELANAIDDLFRP